MNEKEWYLAELVVEITVESNPLSVFHVLLRMVEATDDNSAYDASIAMGLDCNMEYLNGSGDQVVFRFAGLKNLSYIGSDIEHGTELSYEETIFRRDSGTSLPVKEKSKLSAFDTIRRTDPKNPD